MGSRGISLHDNVSVIFIDGLRIYDDMSILMNQTYRVSLLYQFKNILSKFPLESPNFLKCTPQTKSSNGRCQEDIQCRLCTWWVDHPAVKMRVQCINSQLLYQPDELFQAYLFFLHAPIFFRGSRRQRVKWHWKVDSLEKMDTKRGGDEKVTFNILHWTTLWTLSLFLFFLPGTMTMLRWSF